MHATNNPRGFIALISVIVVSFVLIIAVVTLGMRGMTGRFYLLDVERKQISQALAESCVTIGILKIAVDPDYSATNVTAQVGSDTCTIVSVTPNTPVSTQATIVARGVKDGATTNLKVVVDEVSATAVSWLETASRP